MQADKEKQFDEMLEKQLRSHSEPVPADFTDKMLRQVGQAEQRKILARVVLQERLALVGCMVFGIVAIAAAGVFVSIGGGLTEQARMFADKISQVVETVICRWQFYTVFVGMSGFAMYSLLSLLMGE
jgi:hypothetical protein